MIALCLFIIINAVEGTLFHEQSFIEIKPADDIENMAFGYSMGFRKSGELVIGAPYSDLDGRVYVCTIFDIMKRNGVCRRADINVEKLTEYSTRENSTNQHYCLGASIAATENYFLTCAPLWMTSYNILHPEKFAKLARAYGTCFIYNGTAYRLDRMYENFVGADIERKSFSGGIGWTTLVDPSTNLILISKIFGIGHINYIPITNPLAPASSTVKYETFKQNVNNFNNVGSALATGIFFLKGTNQTVYAFTVQDVSMTNKIKFMRYNKNKALSLIKKLSITFEIINAMFGWAMTCADLNGDGLSELLVGAPAQCNDEDAYETGALHIYTGGDLETIGKDSRLRTIIGTKIGSRFGTAIASNDIDGDNFPEVIVSAPYEDFGSGAVYIISGVELNRMLLKDELYKSISLSQLVSTQRIENSKFKSFGFTLQVITDVDDNGRDELAVGCPESSRVIMYRSISSVNVSISVQLLGEQVVRIKSSNFSVRVKIEITYPTKPRELTGKVIVQNSIIGNGVQIRADQDKKIIDLSHKNSSIVLDVNVDIDNYEPGSYMFTTRTKLHTDDEYKSKDFNPKWVTISPQNPMASLEIERRCSGESCLPQLNMTMNWSGSEPYKLGSSMSEVVAIRFKNHGNSSYAQTCAYLRVSGAQVDRIGCPYQDGAYKCLLPMPIMREAVHLIQLKLNMSESTNRDSSLTVDVKFYNTSCTLLTEFQSLKLFVPYELDTDVITMSGLSHERIVTDSDVVDTTVQSFEDAHEYTIENNGNTSWKDVRAVIRWQNLPFVYDYKVLLTSVINKRDRQDTIDEVTYTCTFNLDRNFQIKIIPTTEVLEKAVEKNLVGDSVNVTSILELYLLPTDTKKEFSLSTVIHYRKEFSLGQNKLLIIIIAIIVAVIILAIVIFILRKYGFFSRKTKQKLIEEKNEDVLRRSMKRPTNLGAENTSVVESNMDSINDGLEVVDEPLEPVPGQSDMRDKDSLVTTCEAEIH